MPDFRKVTHDHVVQAMGEYDDLGADAFLAQYGFARTRDYHLRHDGRTYDSKAILGVAHRYATGTVAPSTDFSDGKTGAAKVLRDLDFEVTATEDLLSLETPAPGEWQEAADLDPDVSRDAWAEAAYDVLRGAAGTYQCVVTFKELAAQVQFLSGIRTSQAIHHWIGDVLGRLAVICNEKDEANLASLCVNAQGSVGEAYAVSITALTGERPSDPDDHAAHERLRCYRDHDAIGLPDDGGSRALTPKLAASRSRARKAAREERPVNTCPRCNMAIPPTGMCDVCD